MDMTLQRENLTASTEKQTSPVSSHNEWDPLEEIIVGRLEGSVIPSNHPVVTCNIPGMAAWGQAITAGLRYPQLMLAPAQHELDGFVHLLESLGITVTAAGPHQPQEEVQHTRVVITRILQYVPARQHASYWRRDH